MANNKNERSYENFKIEFAGDKIGENIGEKAENDDDDKTSVGVVAPNKNLRRLKMAFDTSLWKSEGVEGIFASLSALYATLLVSVYLSFAYTELVKFPAMAEYLEINGFFVYLYATSNAYFAYVLMYVLRQRRLVAENDKSHGSLTVRFGAIIFGLGAFAYIFIELLTFFQDPADSPCYHVAKGANCGLGLAFVLLQAYLIFMYPRLNLLAHTLLNRFGTMHVVATNIILWIRTLIKESLEEIEIFEEAEEHNWESIARAGEDDLPLPCDVLLERARITERLREECKHYSRDFLPDNILRLSSPYLYPFIIEYALIGASVTYIMSTHIGVIPASGNEGKISKPNPVKCIQKSNVNHSKKGAFCGLAIVGVATINLSLFFGLEGQGLNHNEAEYVSKMSNTVMNIVGIAALVIGIAELQQLDLKNGPAVKVFDLDMVLLRFTSFFSFMYMILTVITGAFHGKHEDFPDELHIINGVFDVTQVCLQITFLKSLREKVFPENMNGVMPGRQVTVFLFLFNLAQWTVFTFEIQKIRASQVEEGFFGFMPWVIVRRVTLPLAVFFRFHSAVVSIEMWKELYSKKVDKSRQVEPALKEVST